MEFENTDTNSLAGIGLGILGGLLVASVFFFDSEVGQKVYIKKDISIDTDTICSEESRWYYSADSSNRDLKVSLYREKGGTPYDVFYLEPDDFIDLELKPGYNIVHLRTLGEYPTTYTRSKVLQLKPTKIPPPKFSFKRFTE